MSESVRPSIPRPISSRPAVMRDRMATLPLDEADIVGIAVAPIGASCPPPSRSASIPPPLNRKPSAPPSAPSRIPAPPISHIAPRGSTMAVPAPRTFAAPPVPTFDIDLGWDDLDDRGTGGGAPLPSSRRREMNAPEPAPVVPAPVVKAIAPIVAPDVSAAPPRMTMSDPTDLIFDGMYGLTFARSMGEAASMCAETLAHALGARAVVIHTHDLLSGELRAIGAHGDGDFEIIGSAEASDEDLVASAVICNQRSVTMTFDGELPRIAPKRLHAVGAPRSVVAAPAMSWGRCLAIIEVIDADERFASRVADSATYVAEHFAQYLSAHAA